MINCFIFLKLCLPCYNGWWAKINPCFLKSHLSHNISQQQNEKNNEDIYPIWKLKKNMAGVMALPETGVCFTAPTSDSSQTASYFSAFFCPLRALTFSYSYIHRDISKIKLLLGSILTQGDFRVDWFRIPVPTLLLILYCPPVEALLVLSLLKSPPRMIPSIAHRHYNVQREEGTSLHRLFSSVMKPVPQTLGNFFYVAGQNCVKLHF